MEAKSQQENQKFSLASTINQSNLGIWKDYGLTVGFSDFWPHKDTTHYYYSTWPVVKESRFDIAFKIVAKLIESGTIKEMSVKEFITVVKEISDEL